MMARPEQLLAFCKKNWKLRICKFWRLNLVSDLLSADERAPRHSSQVTRLDHVVRISDPGGHPPLVITGKSAQGRVTHPSLHKYLTINRSILRSNPPAPANRTAFVCHYRRPGFPQH